ncbi:DJ-1/PfpI family protein [Bowmanella sp. Y26]|uniref:DJ-1/PfpI family protein n=1 Tax=Bowmanella yangjiangensis TaxID=2811230 RepID=UPI001BDC7081|nr:DJ-1/PfpI family protein [Bowmanella yangjiangensis]MBT1065486.1 DJ-1/PfpI family protein [Bowmanella yangjiangensis]
MKLGVLVFDGFELLDVFGPLEMLGQLGDELSIDIVSETVGSVASAQGPSINSAVGFNSALYDIILVPGGKGTRTEVNNPELIAWISRQASSAKYITAVCTGSALLARAGVLTGKSATTNKLAFHWVASQLPTANWVAKARWVQDGHIFTSAGVSAGIDMSLALIAHIWGQDRAEKIADYCEYVWNSDPDNDIFSAKYNLP